MLRREFLQIITGLGVITCASPSMAQTIDKEKLKSLGDKLSNYWEQNVELDLIHEDKWRSTDVFSFDQSCTLSHTAIQMTTYSTPSQDNP